MKFVIADTYTSSFFNAFYRANPDYQSLDFASGWRRLMDTGCVLADYYSLNLKRLGHDARELIINDELLQSKWMLEHGRKNIHILERINAVLDKMDSAHLDKPGSSIYYIARKSARRLLQILRPPDYWMQEVLLAQVKSIHPDVLLVLSLWEFDEDFLKKLRPHVKLIVAQHASRIPQKLPYHFYDLFLSSLPNFVTFFRQKGVESRYLRLGFEPTILPKIKKQPGFPAVVHIGGYGVSHPERNAVLELVAREIDDIGFWGYGIENLAPDSYIRKKFHGEIWGLDAHDVRFSSKISLTGHASFSGSYANNLTLFETSGVGAMLITDLKDNLGELFDVDREVIAYSSPGECVEKIKYYLGNEDKRKVIASAGQQRTLRDHTFYQRMQELVSFIHEMGLSD